jgi:hypothetical protein
MEEKFIFSYIFQRDRTKACKQQCLCRKKYFGFRINRRYDKSIAKVLENAMPKHMPAITQKKQ